MSDDVSYFGAGTKQKCQSSKKNDGVVNQNRRGCTILERHPGHGEQSVDARRCTHRFSGNIERQDQQRQARRRQLPAPAATWSGGGSGCTMHVFTHCVQNNDTDANAFCVFLFTPVAGLMPVTHRDDSETNLQTYAARGLTPRMLLRSDAEPACWVSV